VKFIRLELYGRQATNNQYINAALFAESPYRVSLLACSHMLNSVITRGRTKTNSA